METEKTNYMKKDEKENGEEGNRMIIRHIEEKKEKDVNQPH